MQNWGNWFSWIYDRIRSILWDSFHKFLNTLRSLIYQMRDSIVLILKPIITQLLNYVISLPGKIWTSILNAANLTRKWFQDLGSQLSRSFSSTSRMVIDTVKSWSSRILNEVFSIVHTLTDISRKLSGWIKEALTSAISFLWESAKKLAGIIAKEVRAVMNSISNTFKPIILSFFDRIREAFSPTTLDEETKRSVESMLTEALEMLKREIEKEAHSPLDPEKAISVASRVAVNALGVASLVLTLSAAADAAHPVKELGFRDIVKTALGLMGINSVIAPYFMIPYEIGIKTPMKYYWNKIYKPMRPGVSDLVRFVVRDVWNPKIITPAPEKFVKEMEYLGYNKFWADAYWTAHWIIPNYEQFREMYWRGKISYDEFMEGVHLADYHPHYDKFWEELSWNLPGKIDARWMYEWGMIGKEELITLLRAAGLHPDWQEKVAEAYIRNQLRDEINRVRTALIDMFRDGFISEDRLRKELKDLGFRDEVIEMSIREAKLKYEKERLEEYFKIWKTAFEKGKVSEARRYSAS